MRQPGIQRRPGFTFVDLTAICAAVMVLLMLLIPAVLATRTSARRESCQNNISYLALAMHNYHDVYGCLAPGWVTNYQDGDSHGGFGWQTAILPFLEQAPLYNRIDTRMALPDADGLDGLLATRVDYYVCPASEAPKTNDYRGGYGTSTYSGNYGSKRPPRFSDGRLEAFWPGAVPAAFMSRKRTTALNYGEVDGIFSWNSNTRFRDISDGTSNTLLIAERGRISRWGIWPGVGANRFEIDAVTDVSHLSPINQSLTGYSSEHGGGIYVGLVDGSVKFLSESVESTPEGGVFQALASKNGNEVFSRDALKNSR